MNKLILIIIGFGAGAHVQAATERVQNVALSEKSVIEVPVAGNRVTTISFPSAIAAVDAALVTTDGKTPGLFQLSHSKGSSFLSVRALRAKAVTNVNVRWNKKTYVFELHESSDPAYSLVLHEVKAKTSAQARPLTPARLLGLLDKAKAYPLLQSQFPVEAAEIERHVWDEGAGLTTCDDYQVKLNEAFRFAAQDTLIFRITVENRTDRTIEHDPEKLEIHAGALRFTPSLADFPTILPPHQSVSGYLVATGNPDGGRNDLSLTNDFTFVLSRHANEPSPLK